MGKLLKTVVAAGVVLLLACSLIPFLWPLVRDHFRGGGAEAWLIPGAPEGHMTVEYEVEVYPDIDESLTYAHVIVPLPVVDNQVPKLVKIDSTLPENSWRFVSDPYPGIEFWAHGGFMVDLYYHVPIENISRMTLSVHPSENTTVVYAEWDGGPKGWFIIRTSLLGPFPDATNSDLRANVFYHWGALDFLEGRRPGWYLIGLENALFAPYLGPTFPENLLLS
jgi:hypothetical protein